MRWVSAIDFRSRRRHFYDRIQSPSRHGFAAAPRHAIRSAGRRLVRVR